jgi:HAMP domain-containing protein
MPPIADLGRWWAALLFGLMLVLLLLITAWLLRAVVPVAPAVNLSAMETSAARPADRVADPMPALRSSLDDTRADESKLKAELADRQAEVRKQAEQCKPAPPLPAERWSKGDLATLRGCWVLGRDVPMTHSFADGRRERVTIKAGRICFDDQGGGLHEQVTIGPTARWDCKAPMTAKFWSNGTLVASQPGVICEGEPLVRWAATRLTCQRVNDEMALCQAVDKSGRTQVEFRREP